ncbi:MAG: ribonucleotide reductase N-terminal alpha domain-containing protein, partial [Anaerolineae bacterium]
MSAQTPIPSRPSDLPAGRWTEAALRVLSERYLLKDARGKVIETPEDLLWRVAWTVASAERGYGAEESAVFDLARAFYGLMVRREFLPNSPTLMNAGKGRDLTFAACYVLPIPDSMDGIFSTLGHAAAIQKAGGGVGYAFSRLRPKGARVRSSGGASSGPISFLREVYDHMTDAVKQGSSRRGANMAILRCDHPDVLEFIDAKRSGGITNFNISVGITDEFMAALQSDGTYALRARAGWPRPEGSDYADGEPYLDPQTGEKVELKAPVVWDRICQAAWATGDPGLFFIDRTNRSRANPVPARYEIESTNPCVTGDTPVATPEGWVPAEKLTEGSAILTVDGPRAIDTVETYICQVFRVQFSDGGELRASPGHQFFARLAGDPCSRPRPIRLDQLRPGDRVQVHRTGHPTLPDINGASTIVAIRPEGIETVYDLHEPLTDTWLPNGYLSRGCGEQPLYPNDQCTLGSLNLGAFVDRVHKQFDWARLGSAARLATRFLDNVLDVSPPPTPEIGELVRSIRRVGLGVMGWADALILLGLPYDSEEAVGMAETVMRHITETAEEESIVLAGSRGPFPLWSESIYRDGSARRNSTLTTVAPTGSISVLAGCSSGIEPLYAIAFTHVVRRDGDDRVLHLVNPLFEEFARAQGIYS